MKSLLPQIPDTPNMSEYIARVIRFAHTPRPEHPAGHTISPQSAVVRAPATSIY
jgi:hypothetical protein